MAGALINSQADRELGPAMRALSEKLRAFVTAKVVMGMNDTDAARHAGYEYPEHHQWRISHREDVQAAILEQSQRLMRSQGPKSILTLCAIRDNPENAARDRIKAATELLNRSGFHQISEHHEHVHQHVSDAEADRRILQLAAELGLDEESARKMLVAPDDMAVNAEGVFELQPKPPRELSTNPIAVSKRRVRARKKMSPEDAARDREETRARSNANLRTAPPFLTDQEYEHLAALRRAGCLPPEDLS